MELAIDVCIAWFDSDILRIRIIILRRSLEKLYTLSGECNKISLDRYSRLFIRFEVFCKLRAKANAKR